MNKPWWTKYLSRRDWAYLAALRIVYNLDPYKEYKPKPEILKLLDGDT